jgi:hypothetical protein
MIIKYFHCLFKDLIYIYTYIILIIRDTEFRYFTGQQYSLGWETLIGRIWGSHGSESSGLYRRVDSMIRAISLMMEEVSTFETPVNSTRLHGATTQKTAIFSPDRVTQSPSAG